MKKKTKSLLQTDTVTKIAYVVNKLSTCFLVKDVTEFKYNHDIIFQGRCPEIAYVIVITEEKLAVRYRKEY